MKYVLPSFQDKSFEEIIQIMQSVPEHTSVWGASHSIDQLDFSKTGIFELSEQSALIAIENRHNDHGWSYGEIVENIIKVINAIPPHIKHVNFSECDFAWANTGRCNDGRLTFEQAESLYAAIGHPRFKEVTFWKDNLGVMPNLEQLFRNLHQERINMAWCHLWQAPASMLERAAKSLPHTVKYLNIANNGLEVDFKLKRFITAIETPSLQEINVAGNHIDDTTYYTPSEVVSIFGPLSTHCKISGIDWEQMCEEAVKRNGLLKAELCQEKENIETSHLQKTFVLSDDMSLNDCIKALSHLFATTRYGFTFISNIPRDYCHSRCQMALLDVLDLQKHASNPIHLAKKVAKKAGENYIQKFEHDMLVYAQSLQNIIEDLPDSRKKMGDAFVGKMLFLVRQFLFEELPALLPDPSHPRPGMY